MKITTGTTEVQHGSVNEPITSIVEGRIIQISLREDDSIRVEGVYEQPDGTLIQGFDKPITAEDSLELYTEIKAALVGTVDTWTLYYTAMIPMANKEFKTTSFVI